MLIKTLSLHGSPYVGIFCSVTDSIALVPSFIQTKELKKIEEALNVEAIPLTIAASHLVGALSKGHGKKFVVASTISSNEKEKMEKQGIHTHTMKEITAIGNLLCLQKNAGIISPLVPSQEKQKIEKFFGIKLHTQLIAKSELPGSCLIATEKGFLAHPKAEPNEMETIENLFKVSGMRTTANYGDAFIGNSILANNHGAIVGERTSGPELARIDEGLHPGLRR